MTFDFGTLIAHAAKTRALSAGTIIGSGTVSNRGAGRRPRQADRPRAASAIPAWPRCAPSRPSLDGAAKTPFLKAGDTVRIEMRDAKRHSIFGAIEQEVAGGMSAPTASAARPARRA